MNHRRTDDSESRFAGYVEGLASVIGHKDREEPLRHYCTGLLMPCERKSVEPMAAITAAQHQSLLHFIGEGKWSDEKVLAKVREMVLPQVERHGAIEAWIIDYSGFPKQGTTARSQYRCRWPIIMRACRWPNRWRCGPVPAPHTLS